MAPSVAQLENTATKTVDKLNITGPSYPFYYPIYDHDEKFPPTELFEHSDPGVRANPAKPNLLHENTTVHHISPYLGTEITGVQLSQLTKEGLDELALYAAERKVVIFRDQDFKDIGADKQIELAKHFGPIQRHPTSGNVKGYPEFHVVYRDAQEDRFKEYLARNRRRHLFLSQVEAYRRLSPEFQKRLEGLRALHSARIGGPVRREPVETEHPLVRVHPVTGEKALYVNQGFTKRIVGFKQEESEYLLKFLFDHLAKGSDFQIRASYRPGTVVVWDNRVTAHSATPDYSSTFRRHAVRLTPQAEVPVPAIA
ncbi:hypothetical protein BDQ17DRAFT_1364817 [Cyathus striatus]|nr:hypothetical protein BDQ17DRAFT_1364817 [Cyathus striatus]